MSSMSVRVGERRRAHRRRLRRRRRRRAPRGARRRRRWRRGRSPRPLLRRREMRRDRLREAVRIDVGDRRRRRCRRRRSARRRRRCAPHRARFRRRRASSRPRERPSAASPRSSATATRVLPTPVSVPVTKMPRVMTGMRAATYARGWRSKRTIGSPSARAPSARPSRRGRRSPRTSPGCGRRGACARAPPASRRQRSRPISPRGRPRVALVAPIACRSRIIASRVGVGERQIFHVHHRIGEAGVHEQVADVVHVDEAADVRVPVDARERRAQLLQRVGTERRERRESADLQHAPEFGERARQVVDPLQREVAPDEIERAGANGSAAMSPQTQAGGGSGRAPRTRPARRASGEPRRDALARGARASAARGRAPRGARADSAARARASASPVPQPASRMAAGASLTTSRRCAMRVPTSRCSTAASS